VQLPNAKNVSNLNVSLGQQTITFADSNNQVRTCEITADSKIEAFHHSKPYLFLINKSSVDVFKFKNGEI
jgi:hypothetical protein